MRLSVSRCVCVSLIAGQIPNVAQTPQCTAPNPLKWIVHVLWAHRPGKTFLKICIGSDLHNHTRRWRLCCAPYCHFLRVKCRTERVIKVLFPLYPSLAWRTNFYFWIELWSANLKMCERPHSSYSNTIVRFVYAIHWIYHTLERLSSELNTMCGATRVPRCVGCGRALNFHILLRHTPALLSDDSLTPGKARSSPPREP